MRKTTLAVVLALSLFSNSSAQLNTVENIRAYTIGVNSRIAEAVKFRTSMYCNEIVVNKTKASWPGSGHYQKRMSLWYSGDPNNSDTRTPEILLEKVTGSSEIAGEKYAEEYVFYNGELIFYYQLNTYKENEIAEKDEHRIYFYKGKMIWYDLRNGSRKVSGEMQETVREEAVRQSKNLLQLFLTSCN